MRKPEGFYRQSGVLALRRVRDACEVLLVSNRKGTRWVIPKGIVEPDLGPGASALKEAWEEAGVRGTLHPEPLGAYRYEKWDGVCTVEVYRMEVQETAEVWPEAEIRQRRWSSPAEAAALVREDGLKVLLEALRVPPGAAPKGGVS